jgi:hypothetical protein
VSTGVRLEWPFQFPARTAMDVGTAPESPPGASAKARGCSAPRPSTLYFTSSDINDEELTSNDAAHVPKLPRADSSWHHGTFETWREGVPYPCMRGDIETMAGLSLE